jgi:hypothetical protein
MATSMRAGACWDDNTSAGAGPWGGCEPTKCSIRWRRSILRFRSLWNRALSPFSRDIRYLQTACVSAWPGRENDRDDTVSVHAHGRGHLSKTKQGAFRALRGRPPPQEVYWSGLAFMSTVTLPGSSPHQSAPEGGHNSDTSPKRIRSLRIRRGQWTSRRAVDAGLHAEGREAAQGDHDGATRSGHRQSGQGAPAPTRTRRSLNRPPHTSQRRPARPGARRVRIRGCAPASAEF